MPYPICYVVAVFKMLIRILNPLRSRIWDMVWFLFSSVFSKQMKKLIILSPSRGIFIFKIIVYEFSKS